MHAKIFFAVLLTVVFFKNSSFASEHEEISDKEWIRGFARRAAKDNPIPKELGKRIEEEYVEATKDPKLETKKIINRKLLAVSAKLTQEKTRALRGPTELLTPPGGGTLDLADYVNPLKGSFQMKIVLQDERQAEQEVSKVYFISGSREREIDGEKFGSGCGKYMDVTSYFKKEMSRKGFILYTADQRYVSVLRGTFILASYLPEALQLASVTFLDSRYSKWDCPLPEVL